MRPINDSIVPILLFSLEVCHGRYQYDINALGAASQLRLTSTRDLNINVSACNANMLFQAFASWNNLSNVHESFQVNYD